MGSIEYVHRRIIEERDRGAAVLVVSSELDEVLALADQIAVIYRGRLVGVVPPATVAEQIGLMMAGAGRDSAARGQARATGRTAPSRRQRSHPGTRPRPPRRRASERRLRPSSPWRRAFRWMAEGNLALVTFLAVVVGLFVGAILIIVTTPATLHAWGNVVSAPGHAFGVTFSTLGNAYGALFTGSIFSPSALGHAISTGSGWTAVFTPISETLVSATPLILAGTGVALGFSTGVFNIGGQGQLMRGPWRPPTSGSPSTSPSCSTCRSWCWPVRPAGPSPGSSPGS